MKMIFPASQILLFVLFLISSCPAQEVPPGKLSSKEAAKSFSGFSDAKRELVKKRDSAIARIAKTYKDEHAKLRKEFVENLQKLLDTETKNGNLDAALEIRDAIRYYESLKPETLEISNMPNKSTSATKSLRGKIKLLKVELAKAQGHTPAKFNVSRPISFGIMQQGELIHTNRDYKWPQIPASIQGWQFTKHAIRANQTYEIDVVEEGWVVVCFGAWSSLNRSKTFFENGWTKIVDLKLDSYDRNGGWVFARKFLVKGRHQIPLGHAHSGTMLLSPSFK